MMLQSLPNYGVGLFKKLNCTQIKLSMCYYNRSLKLSDPIKLHIQVGITSQNRNESRKKKSLWALEKGIPST